MVTSIISTSETSTWILEKVVQSSTETFEFSGSATHDSARLVGKSVDVVDTSVGKLLEALGQIIAYVSNADARDLMSQWEVQ